MIRSSKRGKEHELHCSNGCNGKETTKNYRPNSTSKNGKTQKPYKEYCLICKERPPSAPFTGKIC